MVDNATIADQYQCLETGFWSPDPRGMWAVTRCGVRCAQAGQPALRAYRQVIETKREVLSFAWRLARIRAIVVRDWRRRDGVPIAGDSPSCWNEDIIWGVTRG